MTRSDIEEGLLELGLRRGDTVLLHSSLRSFGFVEGGAETVVDAFLTVLGEDGTLVVPTFGALGIITEVVREHPRAVRSIHPIASVAAIGAHAEAICKSHWRAETAHGADTPYTRIATLGGYVCLAGVDQDRNTTLHTVEALLQLPYLNDVTRTFDSDEGEVTRTWRFFPGPHRDFIGLDRLLRQAGGMRMGRIGDSVIRLVKSQDLLDVCLEAGGADEAFVLCDNPNCADCVAQHAAIRRHRLDRKPFALVAASGLAGRYVPEMIENLQACGIRNVELDLVQGKPVHLLPEAQLQKTVQDLSDADCGVVSARCCAIPEDVESFIGRIADSGVGRIVLPLSPMTGDIAQIASERGLRLSVFNTILGSIDTSRILMDLRQAGADIGFTFSPAGFARAGEKPFLSSYKKKLRGFVDQLDVEDCCFDGAPQPLAEGNAEIKEMISILRCASFDGAMVLTTGNWPATDLHETVARFESLLESM
jgi:aminoglycoside 3-N-acetyltransferase